MDQKKIFLIIIFVLFSLREASSEINISLDIDNSLSATIQEYFNNTNKFRIVPKGDKRFIVKYDVSIQKKGTMYTAHLSGSRYRYYKKKLSDSDPIEICKKIESEIFIPEVVHQKKGVVVINLGKNDGVNKGNRFRVFRNRLNMTIDAEKGAIEITSVRNKYSCGKIIRGRVNLGDIVKK